MAFINNAISKLGITQPASLGICESGSDSARVKSKFIWPTSSGSEKTNRDRRIAMRRRDFIRQTTGTLAGAVVALQRASSAAPGGAVQPDILLIKCEVPGAVQVLPKLPLKIRPGMFGQRYSLPENMRGHE